jgi:hypothetical protein
MKKKVDYSKKLEEFTKKLKKVPEIINIIYAGSTKTKTWDQYSDIDVDIVVKDKDYNKIVKKLPKLLAMWGPVNFCANYGKGVDETWAYIGKDYIKVELDPIKKSELKKRIKKEKIKLDKKEFINFFLNARDSLIYAARHYARGQKLSGASELGVLAGQIFQKLATLKGLKDYDLLRQAEKVLTKKEWNFLKITSCKSLKKREFKRALKANWQYMKYLERLIEKNSGKKLNLKCNDKEILKIIDKTLK